MLHSRCFPEHCRTSPGSPPRPRATALTKVFFVSWCSRPGRSQSATSHLSEIQGDRTWTSLRGAVVQPPTSTAPPVKAQPQPEHKAQHEAAKPGGSQPKPSAQVGP